MRNGDKKKEVKSVPQSVSSALKIHALLLASLHIYSPGAMQIQVPLAFSARPPSVLFFFFFFVSLCALLFWLHLLQTTWQNNTFAPSGSLSLRDRQSSDKSYLQLSEGQSGNSTMRKKGIFFFFCQFPVFYGVKAVCDAVEKHHKTLYWPVAFLATQGLFSLQRYCSTKNYCTVGMRKRQRAGRNTGAAAVMSPPIGDLVIL